MSKSKPARSAKTILIVLFVLLMVALVLVGNFFYNFALNPNSSISFTSRDGLVLSAYELAAPDTHRYAVICHGYQSNASIMGKFARRLHGLGYNVLVPDARGHGLSEGDYIGMGWDEREDIVDWCKRIVSNDPQAQTVYAAACEKEKLVIPGAGHAEAASVDPDLYWSTIETFLAKYM